MADKGFGIAPGHLAGISQGQQLHIRLPLLPGAELRAGRASAQEGSARTLRVLVVDDNQDATLSLASLLMQDGHEVRVAHDGEKGPEIAFAFEPEVVLPDIGMPGMNGLEVAHELRRRWAGRCA